MEQNKKCIADDEFHPIDALLLRKVFETRIALERTRKLLDPLLKWR